MYIGRKVKRNWGNIKEGTVIDEKKVPETSQEIKGMKAKLITPAHTELFVRFGYEAIWCNIAELKFIN